MDTKTKNLLIAFAIMTLVVVVAIGIAVWVLQSDSTPTTNRPYETVTPSSAKAQEVGTVTISPTSIQMQRNPTGQLVGQATLSVANQSFRMQRIGFEGDNNLSQTNDCPKENLIPAGGRCTITVVYNESTVAPTGGTVSVSPSLVVVGTTKTPGGDDVPVDARSTVTGATPITNAAAGAAAGAASAAPAGVDPYGPVNPPPAGSPPVDYSQQQVDQGPPPLTPREQFILARRQAVLGNVVRRDGSQQGQAAQASTGDWDEIGVPKAVSSAPQDMSRVVTMDRIITAVLARNFDSRQGQQVVAQVDRNVYGGEGRVILIPRGSMVIGQMTAGAERGVVNWTQIIRPDGARFVMAATGGDAMGQSGVPGSVNNRYLKRITSVLMGTVLKAGTAYVANAKETPSGTSNTSGTSGVPARNNGAIIADIVAQDIDQALKGIIAQNASVTPIVTIPAGTRLTIVPTQDLVMRPIQRKTIVRASYPRQMNAGAPAPEAESDPVDRVMAPRSGNGYGSQQQRPVATNRQIQQDRQASAAQVDRNLNAPAIARPSSTPPWSSN